MQIKALMHAWTSPRIAVSEPNIKTNDMKKYFKKIDDQILEKKSFRLDIASFSEIYSDISSSTSKSAIFGKNIHERVILIGLEK